MTSKLAVVIVAYQGIDFLQSAIESVNSPSSNISVYVVDNASTDGTAEWVERTFPNVYLLKNAANLGFAGGANVGIRAALGAKADHVFLLNQDARVEKGTLSMLADFLDEHPEASAVQPAIFLPDGTCNTLGNYVHYLGFSGAGGNGLSIDSAAALLPWLRECATWREGVEIPSFSGAAVMVRASTLRALGAFEERFFMYHEDFELSLRMRKAGWSLWLYPRARVIHDYEFSRNPGMWYYIERNRYWALFAHFRLRTLALIALPLLGAEGAVWALAFKKGWAHEKLRSHLYWFRRGSIAQLRQRRRELSTLRRRSDRELLSVCWPRIETTVVGGGRLSQVANSLSAALWKVIYPCIRW